MPDNKTDNFLNVDPGRTGIVFSMTAVLESVTGLTDENLLAASSF